MKVRNKYSLRTGTCNKCSNTDRDITIYYDDFGCRAEFISDMDVYIYGTWLDVDELMANNKLSIDRQLGTNIKLR